MSTRSSCRLAALCGLVIALCGTAARATDDATHDFARYQVILDHAPFGAMAGPSVDIQQPSFSARYTFVGMAKLSDNEPLQAIILDKEGNHVYFKGEGEDVGTAGAVVLKIEKDEKAGAKLVLKQGLEVATLIMDGKSAGTASAPGSPGAAGQPPQPGQPPIPGQPGVRRVPFRRGG
jgi:hypothetical protein